MYEFMGRVHAALAAERGQGTVEYVGLLLLMGLLIAGVVAAADAFKPDETIPKAIAEKLKDGIKNTGVAEK
jgi:hypothetical protein